MPNRPSTRSAITIEVRDSTASAVASAELSTEPIVSFRTTSRTPRPAGAKITTNPAAHASAKAPIAWTSTLPSGSLDSGHASSARWIPNNTYVSTDIATVRTIAARPGRGTSRSRLRMRPAVPSNQRCTRGTSSTQIAGARTRSHQRDFSSSGSTHGSVAAATSTALTTNNIICTTNAARIVRRGMPWRRASDICATTGQTLPGMYLPSWLAENTATDSMWPSGRLSSAGAMSITSMRQP